MTASVLHWSDTGDVADVELGDGRRPLREELGMGGVATVS